MYTSVIFISHFYPIYGSVKVYIFLSKYSLYFLALTGALYIMLCFFRSSNSKLLKIFTQPNATVSTSMSMQRGQPMQQTKSNVVKVPRKKFQKYKNMYQLPKKTSTSYLELFISNGYRTHPTKYQYLVHIPHTSAKSAVKYLQLVYF